MLFKGRLRLPQDAGEGIPVDLTLEDVYLSLVSGNDDLGEWRLDSVEIRRLFSNQFSLMLDGEEMVYIADDALGFAYDGLQFVEDVTERLSKKRMFKGRKGKKPKSSMVSDPEEVEIEPEERIAPEPTPEPEPEQHPEVVPFFPESPSISDPAAAVASEVEGFSPVQARPIEIAGTEPVMPTAPPVAAPIAEPVTPAAYHETVAEEVQPPPPTFVSPSIAQPTMGARVTPPPVPAQPEPQMPPAAAVADTPVYVDEDDDELVIEDVTPYRYAASVSMVPERTNPEPVAQTPAAGMPVEGLSPPAPADPRPEEVHPLGVQEPPAASIPQTGTVSAPEPAPMVVEDIPVVAEAAPEMKTFGDPVAAESFNGVMESNSNGHAELSEIARAVGEPAVEPAALSSVPSETGRGGRHERKGDDKQRGSRFGRKKSRESEDHEHHYESSKTVGGITRSVCGVCGHVSFAGEDVYQNW